MSWTGLDYDDRVGNKSVIAIWAYYCHRCNYVWLPKDFDVAIGEKDGKDLLERQPPKCCARCKSRSWQTILERYDEFNSLARIRAQERVEKSSPDYDPQEEKYLKRLAREFDGDEYYRRMSRYLTNRFLRNLKKEQEHE